MHKSWDCSRDFQIASVLNYLACHTITSSYNPEQMIDIVTPSQTSCG